MLKCAMCFQIKPLSDYYEAMGSRGKQYACKKCSSEYHKEWRSRQKAAPQSKFPTSKFCPDCNQDKPISQFGKKSSNKDKKNDYCKPCWAVRCKIAIRKANERRLNAKKI